MRKIHLTVGSQPIGKAVTWAYPEGDHSLFEIPTYRLTVGGTDESGVKKLVHFEVFRFGVQQKTASSSPRVVGLADKQIHGIKAWLPYYRVHSAPSTEDGAWLVYGNFLIHDGPDNPLNTSAPYASIGCIEVCGGPKGFFKFNDLLLKLSGATGATRNQKLAQIASNKIMKITYLAATRPPIKRL